MEKLAKNFSLELSLPKACPTHIHLYLCLAHCCGHHIPGTVRLLSPKIELHFSSSKCPAWKQRGSTIFYKRSAMGLLGLRLLPHGHHVNSWYKCNMPSFVSNSILNPFRVWWYVMPDCLGENSNSLIHLGWFGKYFSFHILSTLLFLSPGNVCFKRPGNNWTDWDPFKVWGILQKESKEKVKKFTEIG